VPWRFHPWRFHPKTKGHQLAMPDLQVPVKEYFRPNGRSEAKEITIPDGWTEQRAAALNALNDEEIDLTVERFPAMVNICLDDGDFDYRYEVVPLDQLHATILRLLDEFDVKDYHRAATVMAKQT
jgi:hypothetical protein